MKINYVNNNSRVSYEGIFNDVVTDVNSNEKTNLSPAMFEIEKKAMNNDKLIEGLRILLSEKNRDEIVMFSQTTGISIERINAILARTDDVAENLMPETIPGDDPIPGKVYIGGQSETVYIGNNCTHYHLNCNGNPVNINAVMEAITNKLKTEGK